MNVAWATQNASVAPAAVRWGVAGFTPTPLQPKESTAQGDTRAFTYDANRTWYTHTAVMTALKPDTAYWYQVGSNDGWSERFEFVNARKRKPGQPFKHIIFGDLGTGQY